MAIGDNNTRFGTPAAGAFGQPAKPQGSAFGTPLAPQGSPLGQPAAPQPAAPGGRFAAPATTQQAAAPVGGRFAAPATTQQAAAPVGGRFFAAPAATQPVAPAGSRFAAPTADSSQISAGQVAASAAQSAEAQAAVTAFAGKFPGVKFTGVPDITLISADAIIHPGATIEFPDAKIGSITIASGVEIAATAHISTPKDAPAPGVIGARTFTLGGAAALGSAPVVGAGNAASASNGPKNLRIDDCTIEGSVCAWREIVRTTVEEGGSIEGNGGRVEGSRVQGGGKIGGIANVQAVVVPQGSVIEGAVTIGENGVGLGENCYIGGTGMVDNSTMDSGSRKEGAGDLKSSTLEAGFALAQRLDDRFTPRGGRREIWSRHYQR